MTLCIGWKKNGIIKFASDSRVSTDDDHFVDIGIKVMPLPVIINGPIASENGKQETLYNQKLGMCYCGNTSNAFLIKETIQEVLQRLQFIPRYTEVSLKGICSLIEKFFLHTSEQLRNGLNWEPEVEFLIGGYCPKERSILVYKFELVDYDDYYEVICDEVLEDDDEYIIMGSGTEKAEEIIEQHGIPTNDKLLKVLRDVCKDDSIPSVGGYLQYGEFSNNDFRVLGIVDYSINEESTIDYIYTYRGTVLYKDQFEASDSDFHIALDFKIPFEDETQVHWDKLIK